MLNPLVPRKLLLNPWVPKELEWKVFKVTNRYTKFTMYICFERWLAPMKWSWVFFSCSFRFFEVFFSTQDKCQDILDKFFNSSLRSGQKICQKCLDICLVSKITSKKSQRALEKKNACLNFISAPQHSQQVYINSYLALKGLTLAVCC